MASGDLLSIHPTELKFPFELKKQSSCSMQLTNKTDRYVAFKVKTTNPKKYCVRPNSGIVLPGSSCNVTVTMQAQKESPPDMQCKDKFLLQSVAAPDGVTTKDITPEMFEKEDGKVVEEVKLRVVYIPANPPSPVPEESEEGSPSRSSNVEDGNQDAELLNAVSKSFDQSQDRSTEAWSMISKLTDEKKSAMKQNEKLLQELELIRKQSNTNGGGFSLVVVLLVGLIGILVGYVALRT
ncbi:Vesicle-associated protein 1-3 [Linum perenne]